MRTRWFGRHKHALETIESHLNEQPQLLILKANAKNLQISIWLPQHKLQHLPALHKPQEVSKVQAMVIDVVAFANPWHQWWLREIFFLDGIESFFWKKRPQKTYAVHIISTLVSWERSFGLFLTQGKTKVAWGLVVGSRFTLENLPRFQGGQRPTWSKLFSQQQHLLRHVSHPCTLS